MSPDRADLGQIVAQSADAGDLHAPVATLLLELQTLLGTLAATVAGQTGRGRQPFRPGSLWPDCLGELAYGVYLLADQTGVDLHAAVSAIARKIAPAPEQRPQPDEDQWPIRGG